MLNKLVEKMTECYNSNDFSDIINYLDENCIYTSQWVLDEISGNSAVASYLIDKTKAIAKSGSFATAKTVEIKSPVQKHAVLVSQSGTDVMVLVSEKDGKISAIELCMPSLFEF